MCFCPGLWSSSPSLRLSASPAGGTTGQHHLCFWLLSPLWAEGFHCKRKTNRDFNSVSFTTTTASCCSSHCDVIEFKCFPVMRFKDEYRTQFPLHQLNTVFCSYDVCHVFDHETNNIPDFADILKTSQEVENWCRNKQKMRHRNGLNSCFCNCWPLSWATAGRSSSLPHSLMLNSVQCDSSLHCLQWKHFINHSSLPWKKQQNKRS